MGRFAKAFGAILGGLSPAAVVGVLALFHVSVSLDLVTAFIAVVAPLAATLGVVVAPANREKDAAMVSAQADAADGSASVAVHDPAVLNSVAPAAVLDPSVLNQ